ncbi:hypothetical protein MTY_1264 [Moorella thermoacetica Y72]|uniref:Uncharacterized protein n=1 Tax=Moorella thermoacetica Y72 TaxID=1325331 RepID=A0A0S6U9X2_NEOTH|nr:hypothetical protein MTY_1264 [Moorella thermoacetica Y72]
MIVWIRDRGTRREKKGGLKHRRGTARHLFPHAF